MIGSFGEFISARSVHSDIALERHSGEDRVSIHVEVSIGNSIPSVSVPDSAHERCLNHSSIPFRSPAVRAAACPLILRALILPHRLFHPILRHPVDRVRTRSIGSFACCLPNLLPRISFSLYAAIDSRAGSLLAKRLQVGNNCGQGERWVSFHHEHEVGNHLSWQQARSSFARNIDIQRPHLRQPLHRPLYSPLAGTPDCLQSQTYELCCVSWKEEPLTRKKFRFAKEGSI
jgi:hypothetical protein